MRVEFTLSTRCAVTLMSVSKLLSITYFGTPKTEIITIKINRPINYLRFVVCFTEAAPAWKPENTEQ